jgi:hypothetical protein
MSFFQFSVLHASLLSIVQSDFQSFKTLKSKHIILNRIALNNMYTSSTTLSHVSSFFLKISHLGRELLPIPSQSNIQIFSWRCTAFLNQEVARLTTGVQPIIWAFFRQVVVISVKETQAYSRQNIEYLSNRYSTCLIQCALPAP